MKVKTLIKKLLDYDSNAQLTIGTTEWSEDYTKEEHIDYKIIDIFELPDVVSLTLTRKEKHENKRNTFC